MKTIPVGEAFLSIQGEGPTTGSLAIFIRTTGCTLDCSWCDSAKVWKTKGFQYSPADLATYVRSTYEQALSRGAHIILTGGSPLMRQDLLLEFLTELRSFRNPVEVETEAVLQPKAAFDAKVVQYNVSPKLANSGMSKERRYNKSVLQWHAHKTQGRSHFKFVVATKADVQEVSDFQFDIGIPTDRIWLMPLVSTKAEHDRLAPEIARCAISEGYNFSPRLHIQLWDQVTGV